MKGKIDVTSNQIPWSDDGDLFLTTPKGSTFDSESKREIPLSRATDGVASRCMLCHRIFARENICLSVVFLTLCKREDAEDGN